MTDPLIGRVVGERFRITSRIGEGGMGVVYLAEDKATEAKAALKFLHRHLLRNADFVARFRQEARSASRFRHECAVRILSAGEDEDGGQFIAMEYCPGRSLKTVLRDEGPLATSRACSIAEQIFRALAEAHKHGIVHRDLKPENIRIEADATGDRVKILDFGVAKFIGTEDLEEMTGAVKTKTGVVFGTPKYMAPEQIVGEAVDGRSDIYSVGAMLYEMLSGSPPFRSDDILGFVTKHLKEPVEPLSIRAPERNLPPDLEDLVLEMLEKNRVARPARAAEVADSLVPFLRPGATPAPDPEHPSPLGALAYLVGGAAGAAGAAFLAPAQAAEGIAVGAGLGVGSAAAFMRFPRVGDLAFWMRTIIVAATLFVAGGTAWMLAKADLYLSVSMAIVGLLVFVLFSMAWGRRRRLASVLLAGVLAPVLAAPLLPFPAARGYLRVWELQSFDVVTLSPMLAVGAIGAGFALAALLCPRALRAAPLKRGL